MKCTRCGVEKIVKDLVEHGEERICVKCWVAEKRRKKNNE